jgi:5-methylcytosine-specific restriction endonuclease McrA
MSGSAKPPAKLQTPLVVRSNVQAGLRYGEYREHLRHDFFCSCAYCSMSEAEALAIRFTIDHYEPKTARPELENEYSNLMYACDECNTRKGDRSPPPDARANGIRFYRPDTDVFDDHFELSGIRLNPRTSIGDYSIEAIDLNRYQLRKLRELRQRLANCQDMVAQGVLALRRFHLDQLPTAIKLRAAGTINRAIALAESTANEIDDLLRNFARSPLIDDVDETTEHVAERNGKLNGWEAMYPGIWRGRSKRKG